jgi:predicted nucleic acid-binding protein
VRLETEAVLGLVQLSILGELRWVTSDALELESSQNPDTDRRGEVDLLLRTATTRVAVGLHERQRGRELEALGFKAFDALHIACAERASVDALLTTDDRLWRRAQRETGKLAVRVENPAKWYPEAIAP